MKTLYYPYNGVYLKSRKINCGEMSIDIFPAEGKLSMYASRIVDEYNKIINPPKVYKK